MTSCPQRKMLPISALFSVCPELFDHTQSADVVPYCQAHTMRGTIYINPLLESTKPAHLSRHCFSGFLILQMDPNYLYCNFCRYLQQWINLYSSSYKRVWCVFLNGHTELPLVSIHPYVIGVIEVVIRSDFHLTHQFSDKSLTHSWMLMELNMMMWTELFWLRMGPGGKLLWMR